MNIEKFRKCMLDIGIDIDKSRITYKIDDKQVVIDVEIDPENNEVILCGCLITGDNFEYVLSTGNVELYIRNLKEILKLVKKDGR